MRSGGMGESPKPGRSSATVRRSSAERGMFSIQFCHWPPSPWMNTTGVRWWAAGSSGIRSM